MVWRRVATMALTKPAGVALQLVGLLVVSIGGMAMCSARMGGGSIFSCPGIFGLLALIVGVSSMAAGGEPARAEARAREAAARAERAPKKKCAACAEMILAEAKKCRFCGEAQPT